MSFLLFLLILAAVAVFVTRPLWRTAELAPASQGAASQATDLADLEAAREAKYREIREAELDHRTGKLSKQDFELIDGALRAEAVQILKALDHQRALRGLDSEPDASKPPGQANGH